MIFIGAFISFFLGSIHATQTCDEANSCRIDIGQSLPQITASNFLGFNITSAHSFYFHLNVPANSPRVDIIATTFYGNVEMFCAIGDDKYNSRSFKDMLTISNTKNMDQVARVRIFALTNAMIRLAAFSANAYTQLYEGYPQLTRLFKSSPTSSDVSIYFTFVPKSTKPLSLGVTYMNLGEVALLIESPVDGRNAGRNWTRQRAGDRATLLSLAPTAEEVGKPFRVTLSSQAWNTSLISQVLCAVVLSTNTPLSPIHMPGGMYLVGDLSGDSSLSRYYSFHVPPGEDDVFFLLSPFYGNPDLFVNVASDGFYTSNNGSGAVARWESAGPSGSDGVLIDHSQSAFLSEGGQYLVTVGAAPHSGASAYVVVGMYAGSVMRLAEGVTTRDFVSGGSYHYYMFTDSGHDDEDSFVLDVSSTHGNPNLLVGCVIDPSGDDSGYPSVRRGHYNYSSHYYGEDSIVIKPSDSSRCRSGVYYAAVYARETCVFTLTLSQLGGGVTLHDGVPVTDTAYAHTTLKYRFYMGWEKQKLTVTLTPETGNADLEVYEGKYVFWGSRLGVSKDVVVINEDTMCDRCVVTIYVSAAAQTKFSLVAVLEDTPQQLRNGVPMTEEVAERNIQYFYLTTRRNGTAHIVLTPLSGHPILYVSKEDNSPSDATSNICVDRGSELGLVPYCTFEQNTASGSTLYIGVGGGSSNSSFTVRASVDLYDEMPLYSLSYGVPQNDIVGDAFGTKWRFYSKTRPAGHDSIVVRAVALSGHVDIYVSKCPLPNQAACIRGDENGTLYFPDLSQYMATTKGLEEDVLTISRFNPDFTNDVYFIGIYSADREAAFQLSMELSEGVLMLQPGVAVKDQVWTGEEDYFGIYVSAGARQILKVSFASINSRDAEINIYTQATSNRTQYVLWRRTLGDTVINIDTHSPGACVQCIYYITIRGMNECKYSIMASVSTSVGRLQDGQPLLDAVGGNEYARYAFEDAYGVGRDLQISFDVRTGGAELFVTFDGTQPSQEQYALRSLIGSFSDHIIVRRTDEIYRPCIDGFCHMRAAVRGLSSYNISTFQLSVTSSEQNTALRLGIPFRAKVSAGTQNYFKLSVVEQQTVYTLRLSVVELSGDVAVFVSCHDAFPNASSYDWYLHSESDILIDLSSKAYPKAGNCSQRGVYFVTVAAAHGKAATYSILGNIISNTTAFSLLSPGNIHVGRVKYHEFEYYYLSVDPIGDSSYEDTRIMVTAAWGDVDVYISAGWANRPCYSQLTDTVSSYNMKGASIGGENVVITPRDVHSMCSGREQCLLIIGVFSVYSSIGPGTTYRIEVAKEGSMTVLSASYPVQGLLKPFSTHYYRFTVISLESDISLTVTTLQGDPDILIGMKPIYHPSPENYTWVSAKFGSDSITVQANELSKRCTVNATDLLDCDLFIAIYATVNTSYSLVATADNSFRNPIILLDGQPQSSEVLLGGFKYYDFFVSPKTGSDGTLVIAATSFDYSDVDIYVKFGGSDDERGEPGPDNYDYASNSFLGVTEEVIVSAYMPCYCTHCVVHIGVYGKREGSFSLVASASGYSQLLSDRPVGGHLSSDSYRYYYLRNVDSGAEITITLTAFAGDPDLYVTAYDDNADARLVLPTTSSATWESVTIGTDTVSIDYSDENFCSDCLYIIGVYAYENATYTLTASTNKAAVLSLRPSKPQFVTVGASGLKMRYFRYRTRSSTEAITISLTRLGTGNIEVFAQTFPQGSYNGSLPDPDVRATYSYFTISPIDHIRIPGPFHESTIIALSVLVSVAMSFSILVSASAEPILLQQGVPQTHFIATHSMALFNFYLSELEDVQFTLTTLSGEPQLYIASDQWFPECSDNNHYHQLECGNFTWATTDNHVQQIAISKDFPCRAQVAETMVFGCNPSDFHVGDIHIGVFGYTASRFSLVATRAGQHIRLTPGVSQMTSTSLGYMCSLRNGKNGACASHSMEIRAQVSYFSLQSGAVRSSLDEDYQWDSLMISVIPDCHDFESECRGGCEELCPSKASHMAPLMVYIISCLKSECLVNDQYPSPFSKGTNVVSFPVRVQGNTVVLDSDSESGYCQATETEECMYYIAVAKEVAAGSSTEAGRSARFSISATHLRDVEHIPCEGFPPTPDGVRQTQIHSVKYLKGVDGQPVSTAKKYELCMGHESDSTRVLVSVEECSGGLELFACEDSSDNKVCTDFLPSTQSWEYRASEGSVCERTVNEAQSYLQAPSEVCEENQNHNLLPQLPLPVEGRNYHLLVSGWGSYFVQVQQTSNSGHILGPRLVTMSSLTTGEGDATPDVVMEHVSSSSIIISWTEALMIMPGLSPTPAADMQYKLFVVDPFLLSVANDNAQDRVITTTLCGLEHAQSALHSVVQGVILPSSERSYKVKNLLSNRRYTLYVVAICDSACLRQFGKVHVSESSSASCSGQHSCADQYVIYQELELSTLEHSESSSQSGDSDSSSSSSIIVSAVMGVTCVLFVAAVYMAVTRARSAHASEILNEGSFEMSRFPSSRDLWGDLEESSTHSQVPLNSLNDEEERGGSYQAPHPTDCMSATTTVTTKTSLFSRLATSGENAANNHSENRKSTYTPLVEKSDGDDGEITVIL